MLNRRQLMAAAGAGLLGTGWLIGSRSRVYGQPLGPQIVPGTEGSVALTLIPAERQTELSAFAGNTLPLWTFSEESWLPVVRLPLGARLEAEIHNQLPREDEHASIHWHGIRLPNDQDGVPYLVQDPVFPGQSYHYSFVPPDTGTFFFHTHCNTAEHFGRGLVGVLIVDGDTTEDYDADEIVVVRDWRVNLDNGEFLPFTTNRGAARAGTFGALRTINGAVDPDLNLPSSADCRLRLLNLDPTRVIEVGLDGAEAAIVAVDGIAVEPFALDRWQLGPAMRVDLVVRTPRTGRSARLVDFQPDEPVQLARITGIGEEIRTGSFQPAPLRAGRIPEPDLANATDWLLEFGSIRPSNYLPPDISPDSPLADLYLGPLCRSSVANWTIAEVAWPAADHSIVPAPLAELQLGRSYRLTLKNNTPFLHPIHIHGHSFKVLQSDQRPIIAHHADTVMLQAEETIEVAFVADNPGKWMIHCHIAEHQETGMMGFYTVG